MPQNSSFAAPFNGLRGRLGAAVEEAGSAPGRGRFAAYFMELAITFSAFRLTRLEPSPTPLVYPPLNVIVNKPTRVTMQKPLCVLAGAAILASAGLFAQPASAVGLPGAQCMQGAIADVAVPTRCIAGPASGIIGIVRMTAASGAVATTTATTTIEPATPTVRAITVQASGVYGPGVSSALASARPSST